MIKIRSFRNTDAKSLCSVWNAHHAESGLDCQIDPLRLELFSLAKPYFRAGNLLIAEDERGEVLGFLQFGPTGSADGADTDMSRIGLSAICIRPGSDEDAIAQCLFDRLAEIAVSQNIQSCLFRPLLPDCAFYLGLGPADSLASAISPEVRVCKWLAQSGYRPQYPTCLWELDLYAFQAPVDRMQIQIRRSAVVHQQLDEPSLPWWHACVLGHTEPSAFYLTHRTEKRVLKEVLFWTLSPELQASPTQVVWLWPTQEGQDSQDQDFTIFLLAEAVRQYQEERIEVIRTASKVDDRFSNATYQRLGFKPAHNGMVFEKRYS